MDETGVLCRSISLYVKSSGAGRWQHICREANIAAHVMAHVETRWDERMVWIDDPPTCLIYQLQLDNVTAFI
ncbi:unnamed protein product [Linum tenue]|uniref:RNase H type-1 domain-containing protein n=1 Tax=Linum tenue TaxID=586396 RepID=A0AAV0R4B5_9ROSI|nr:unnamed protein product [Linum tenue]